MANIETYKQGETAVLTGYFTDKDNEAADPSISRKIRIADPTGTLVVLTGTLTEDDLVTDDSDKGRWKYPYTFAADALIGEWKHEIIGTDGAGLEVSMGEGAVRVIRRLANAES